MMADTPVQLGRAHALLLWIRGRSAPVPAHSTVFTAQRGTLGLPLMFGAATVIEMVVLHLLIPWLWLSALIAALSVASLVLLASSVAQARVHPHILSPTTLTLRTSGKVVATVDRASILSARIHRRYGVVSPALDGGRLVLPSQDGTSVDIELTGAVDVALPALLQRQRVSGCAHSFSVQVDDPTALVAELTRLAGPPVVQRSSSRTVNDTTTGASTAFDPSEL